MMNLPQLLGIALLWSLSIKPVGQVFAATVDRTPAFLSARPIWLEGREKEKNLSVGFRAVFEPGTRGKIILRATGASLYRVFLNGQFLGHGPARGPHGFFRVDEWDLAGRLRSGRNVVAFEVAGYNANSYYLLDQPSFLQAEIEQDGKTLAATGNAQTPFFAVILEERVQKVQRYSFQRPFSEVYKLESGYDNWRTETDTSPSSVAVAVSSPRQLLLRRVDYPAYALRQPLLITGDGQVRTRAVVPNPWKDRSLTDIGPKLAGYPEKELAVIPSIELQSISNVAHRTIEAPYDSSEALTLEANNFKILDFGCNLTGFIGARVSCTSKVRLFLTFDEILSSGDVDFKRLSCVNALLYELDPGIYDLESFEPYTFRYLKATVLEGRCEIKRVYLREYSSERASAARFLSSDERLNRLFAAGCETFRQNAVDIFMDCPSRERAGWLCDSFFTARVAKDLCGNTRIEENFLENYSLPRSFAFLPDGMLPMCYPADHNDGVFIPNWALWFVVELEEYLARSGDRHTIEALRPRVLGLLEYFKKFRNPDGLLEKLENWVFIEWSEANSFGQDVNYPSNMLYAKALEVTGRLYGLEGLEIEATRLRKTIHAQSFDGQFFVDNAVRVNGKLQITTNRTEVCQYFAFFFDVASPTTDGLLWKTLCKDFGPQRKRTKEFPQIHPANAFVGTAVRLELLSRYGLCQQLLDESVAYQLYMADRTGTLWENDGAYASCNHGFASHGGVHVLYRDVLGLRNVDSVNKLVTVRFTDVRLDCCEGTMPAGDGIVTLKWRGNGNKLAYQLDVPPGYQVKIENQSGRELVRM